ncbi:MAG: ABC transporter permease [Lachnospiraceae bacterium]|nr:ABC transporter permease [Lachnospiraceae bacterium]
MKKNLLLIHSNLRKGKGQAAAIAILIFLAALLFNLWLMLSTDYKQNFDRCHDKMNAEHVTFVVDDDSEQMREFLAQTIENDGRTSEFFLDQAMQMVGLFHYNGGEVNSELVFLEKQTAISRPVGKVEIVEDSDIQSGIYMPVLYKSEDIAIGKTVTISIGSNTVSYTVCGFFNSVMAGSHNCSLCELVLTEDKYKELEETGYAPKATLCSVRLKDKGESAGYETELKNQVASRYPMARAASNSYALVSQSRYISQMICAGVMGAMAFLILLIALAVMSSNIVNYIQENMRDLGVLKAAGYTGSQLTVTLQVQFLGITLAAAIAGTGISYCLFPSLNEMMISQTGIPYEIHFLPLPMLISLLILGGASASAVWLSARRIKKIEPITALRQGIRTHNFKRNHVPLEKTRAPLDFALAFKTTLSGVKNNVTVCITMLVLSLVVVFSGLMVENMIRDIDPFLNLIVGEMADSCINVNVETEEDFLQEMSRDARVEKVYLYNSLAVSHKGSLELVATVCDDFSKVNNQGVVFKGRFPKFDNEIAVAAKYAKEKNLSIGDEMSIMSGGKEAKYIISGYTQISNNLGRDCLFTRSGYQRMGELQNTSYYINLVDGADIEEFNSEIKEQFGDGVNATINIETTIQGAASVYVSLMRVIVFAVFILGFIVVVFVLYLLVRTMLNNKKRNYGIMKALGFTTGQLIRQTAISFMPAVVVSTILGLALSSLIINPLTAVFLSGIGIVKCTFTVPVGFVIMAGAGLILFTFGAACLLSLKIKRIAPRALLAGE